MKKILVIEDDEPLRNITVKLLNLHGYDAVASLDSIAGVQIARETIPDLILCDVMMPDLDGYGVLQILRHDTTTITIPIILVTAKAERAAMRRGMELGADDYLTKPFTSDELLATVAARFEKQAVIADVTRQKLNDLRERITLALPHEVRTPLNSIIGFSDILVTGASVMEPEQIIDAGQRINRSAWRLWRLVENYLAYAQITIMKANAETINDLHNEATTHPKLAIEDQVIQKAHQTGRQADLEMDVDDADVVMIAENHLRKIIIEVVDNAFKFSVPGEAVSVLGQCHSSQYCLQVIDRGRGMTSEQIENIGAYMQFERRMYEQQGAELGLIIAKELTELYGGNMLIESVPNEYTTVSINLPLKE